MRKALWIKKDYLCMRNLIKSMKRKKKRILGILGIILLLAIFFIGGSIWQNIGTLDTKKERILKFGGLSYYSLQNDVFVSPEELTSYPERTTGGRAGFRTIFQKISPCSGERIAESCFEENGFCSQSIGLCPLLVRTFICPPGIRRCTDTD